MRKIRIAIVGIGNCASSLVQGINFYDGSSVNSTGIGLMHRQIGSYRPGDIEVVAAFDIDRRKVGLDVGKAIFSPPNCTKVFCEKIKLTGAIVKMGCVFDGYPQHMREPVTPSDIPSSGERIHSRTDHCRTERLFRGTDGQLFAGGLRRGDPFFMPVARWRPGLASSITSPCSSPATQNGHGDLQVRIYRCIGDDIKAQMGATIVHRALVDLFRKRGVKLVRTYQLNTGGNTDFLNMLNRTRLASKKTSKTEAVQSVIGERLTD